MLLHHREHRRHRGQKYARGVLLASVSAISVLSV
jgi:hypothetical protein